MLVTELKSEALKERHWKQLMKNLRVRWQLHDLTLGQVWAVDLQRNEMVVKDVILVAQGEMALEEFLKMVSGYRSLSLSLSSFPSLPPPLPLLPFSIPPFTLSSSLPYPYPPSSHRCESPGRPTNWT